MQKSRRSKAHYIHRISYSTQERIVGTFVLLAVGVLVWLLISSQKTRELFEEEITLYGTMTSIQAVDKNTDVIISGLNVGTVSDINIDDRNHVVVTMHILKKYQKLIRTDSIARLLDFKFAMLGKSVIEITVGSPDKPVIADNTEIRIEESLNLTQLASKFEPVINSLQDSIQRINEILQAIEPEHVSGNIRNLDSITANLKAITAQIKQGKGSAGAALYDENMQADILQTTANMKNISEQVVQLLQDIQQQLDTLGPVSRKIEPLMDKAESAIEQASEIAEEADVTIKATQQIWPISGNIPDAPGSKLLTPEAVE